MSTLYNSQRYGTAVTLEIFIMRKVYRTDIFALLLFLCQMSGYIFCFNFKIEKKMTENTRKLKFKVYFFSTKYLQSTILLA